MIYGIRKHTGVDTWGNIENGAGGWERLSAEGCACVHVTGSHVFGWCGDEK